MTGRQRAVAAVAVVAAVGAWFLWPRGYCRDADGRYGLRLPQCPDGRLRQQLQIRGEGLRRGGPGRVHVGATALYTIGGADEWRSATVGDLDVQLALVAGPSGDGKPVAIKPTKAWKREGGALVAEIQLPDVPDGDYRLRATVASKVAKGTIDLPLPLYAPARIHVITDRPLYEPGNVVSFRALALRASDLAPIDHRPGVWIIRDPSGTDVLEERAPAGEWGVVAGDFPLDRGALSGDWTVTWRSGGTEASRTFRVEPFTLPRFRVEAAAGAPFYQAGAQPVVAGAVTYSSGAPVAGAGLEIAWQVDAPEWPPPTGWLAGGLPQRAATDGAGRFTLRLPAVPPDLIGQARLTARIAATDPAGDRVVGSASVLLSQEAIQVQAITELAATDGDGGLVAGFNNRVYLRVTTADGRPLPGVAIHVARAWAAGNPGIDAVLDEDAVARIQIDPGPPVNVVLPARPVRAPPPPPPVVRTGAIDALRGAAPSLADQVAIDGWNDAIAGCARLSGPPWEDGSEANKVTLVLEIDAGGAIVDADARDGDLSRCLLGAIRGRRLPAGSARMLVLDYQLRADHLPRVAIEATAPLGVTDEVRRSFGAVARDSRDCVPADLAGKRAGAFSWRTTAGSRALRVGYLADAAAAGETPLPAEVARCLQARIARHPLAAPAALGRIGIARVEILPPAAAGGDLPAPQPTILQGYELLVTARPPAGPPLGEARLRMLPGSVPPLRLRATPVLAKPGETIQIELVRGPDFSGELPPTVAVDHLGDLKEAKLSADRTASYQLPADAAGWYELRAAGARALVYVRSGEELAVAIEPGQPRYRPGERAHLAIQTRIGGKGAKAAVGLIGVDESLAQLTPLPGPDDLGSVRPTIAMQSLAFDVLDGGALALGRIRGTSAAEATILRVASVPTPAALDAVVDSSAEEAIDPIAELTDRFYAILGELHGAVRSWEATAPPAEQMKPETMAKLWERALDAAKAKGISIEDAFGRRLRLHRLPPDLLALTDPRQLVVVGVRLPEDVESWPAWVARRKP